MTSDTHPAPRKLDCLHHAAFRCRDAEQTYWFYSEVLGLECAGAVVLDGVPGTEHTTPYMHIFFELGDGNYIAFFDSPGDADPDWFERKDSFDLHIALQTDNEANMLAMQARIRSYGINCSSELDHDFVRSVYMYDPNGIQVEITVRTPDHDAILAHEAAQMDTIMARWNERTRTLKREKFGADLVALRGSAPRRAAAR